MQRAHVRLTTAPEDPLKVQRTWTCNRVFWSYALASQHMREAAIFEFERALLEVAAETSQVDRRPELTPEQEAQLCGSGRPGLYPASVYEADRKLAAEQVAKATDEPATNGPATNGPTPDAKPAPTDPPGAPRPALTVSVSKANVHNGASTASRKLEAALEAAEDIAEDIAEKEPLAKKARTMQTRALKTKLSDY